MVTFYFYWWLFKHFIGLIILVFILLLGTVMTGIAVYDLWKTNRKKKKGAGK